HHQIPVTKKEVIRSQKILQHQSMYHQGEVSGYSSFPVPRHEEAFQSFGSAYDQYDEHDVDQSYSRSGGGDTILDPIVEEDRDNNGEPSSQSTRRTPTRPFTMIPLSPSARRFPRSRHHIPGSYSASYSSERVPWNTLRQFNDSLVIGSPQSYYVDDGVPTSMFSPTEEGFFNVIVDDVFFNPAKTLGGMYEAVLYAILGGIYGMLVGYGSMKTANFFYSNDMPYLDYITTVFLWCGGNMFLVALSRAKLNKPTFNSACSLANIIIFVTLTREGAQPGGEITTRLIQVSKIIIIGICISFLVSVLVWPVSASKKLRKEITDTLGSFRLLLILLTKTFLIDDIRYTDKSVQSAIASYRASFTSLQDSLKQAALEVHNGSIKSQLKLYKEAVDSLNRLAQHLGGLRSCCGLQWEIIKDQEENKESNKDMVDEQDRGLSADDDSYDELRSYRILIEFIHYVGPPMKSLAYTCKRTISRLQDQFKQQDTFHSTSVSFSLLHQNLQSALKLFKESQTRALNKLYKENSADNFDGRPNEEIFLIYFFVFNLQEFAKELIDLVDLVGMISRIDEIEQERKAKRKWWQFWLFFSCFTRENSIEFDHKNYFEKVKHKFPENTNNLFDTVQTPKPKTLWQKITMNIWKSLSWFRQFQVKYAFKAAISAIVLVSPAFFDATRPTYYEYRGEWTCITMMVVMVPTVGGTNLVAIYRILGTLFGSYLAWVIYTFFPDNPVVLSVSGFVIALSCFQLILYTKYNRIGTFILLTYNLVALYKYNIRDLEPPVDVSDIARTRFIAVGTGVVWGVLVTNYWWPYEARVELRKGLSQLIINISWLYKKLVAVYSNPPGVQENCQNGNMDHHNVTIMLSHNLSKSTKEFMDMELFLQVSLLKLYDLLAQTPNEPRMKGPFPTKPYREILGGCQNILDKLLSIRISVTREDWYMLIRRDFILPITNERKELVGNVLLYFYILAAALRLKTPLPPYLPPAEKARRRLVKKIRDLPVVKHRVVEGNDERYMVYYAYALVIEDVIRELEKLGKIMQELFGCMGGDEFNTFFSEDQLSPEINDVSTTNGQ
ncbi:784_t:CDS:2, partial [Acaulospora colombiana]